MVGIVTMLPAGRVTGSNTGRDEKVFLSSSELSDRLCAPPILIRAEFRGYFCVVKRPERELPHLKPVSVLGKSRAVPLLLPCAFMA